MFKDEIKSLLRKKRSLKQKLALFWKQEVNRKMELYGNKINVLPQSIVG
jgi:hypothetical protein